MSYPKIAMLALPYSRMELPGWGRLLRRLGVFSDPLWLGAPRRTMRGKWHGYRMTVCLNNWSERQTFFLGRFYDLPTQLFIRSCLREGESFVDIGGNIGMITLLAARCVGETGKVYTFEPNPEPYRRLEEMLAENHLSSRVRLYNVALSDADDEMTLRVVTEHTGMGTLAELPPEHEKFVSNTYRVEVRRGDDVLHSVLQAPAVIKIDVEGFECRVLRGMRRTLSCHKPAVVAETVPRLLQRAGTDLAELYTIMREAGYEAFNLTTRRGLISHCVRLARASEADGAAENNSVWLHPGSVHWERMAADMVGVNGSPA